MALSSNSRQPGRGGRQRERNGYRERWRKKNMQWDSKSDCSLLDKVIESQLKRCHVYLSKGPFTQDGFLPSKTARHVSTAEDVHLRPDYAEKQHLWMQKRELFQVSCTVPLLRNTRFFLYAIPQWSSDLITCLLSEQSNEVIITQRQSINPTQESSRINAPIQAPVIGHRERECERWREREREKKEPCRRVEQGSTLTAPTIRGRSSNLISHSGNNREDDQHAGSCFVWAQRVRARGAIQLF